jgi:hypothetical protein
MTDNVCDLVREVTGDSSRVRAAGFAALQSRLKRGRAGLDIAREQCTAL